MSDPSSEIDLEHPLGGRLGLLLVAAAALAGLVQGLAPIMWNSFAISPPPEPPPADVNPLLREAPPPPKAKAPVAEEAAKAATEEVNKAPEPEPVPTIEVTPAAPKTAEGSPLPPYGSAGNATSAPAAAAPAQPAPAQPAPPATPEPEDQPPL